MNFVRIEKSKLKDEQIEILQKDKSIVLIFEADHENRIGELRRFFFRLKESEIGSPVIIKMNYSKLTPDKLSLYSSADFASLLVDGLGDGIWIENASVFPCQSLLSISFGILQAIRSRITKTEYIACPSCGRTHFDIQETLQEIRAATGHLSGLKIGVMGCIVNGPGEMADADYGYVGSGSGRIDLFKGQDVIRKNIYTCDAVDELLSLIKKYGDWNEPEIM